METFTRQVTWGQALRVDAENGRGGLAAKVKRITAVVGPHFGTRNTFAKLYDLDAPPDNDKDRFRSWLLLVACGRDPADWWLDDDAVPAMLDASHLRQLLTPPSDQGGSPMRWTPAPARAA